MMHWQAVLFESVAFLENSLGSVDVFLLQQMPVHIVIKHSKDRLMNVRISNYITSSSQEDLSPEPALAVAIHIRSHDIGLQYAAWFVSVWQVRRPFLLVAMPFAPNVAMPFVPSSDALAPSSKATVDRPLAPIQEFPMVSD